MTEIKNHQDSKEYGGSPYAPQCLYPTYTIVKTFSHENETTLGIFIIDHHKSQVFY
jgi:hypothetical protein